MTSNPLIWLAIIFIIIAIAVVSLKKSPRLSSWLPSTTNKVSGTHIVSNCYGCDFSEINRLGMSGVEEFISSLVRKYGLTEVARKYHDFGQPNAFTGASILAESHICIHTWPEHQMVTVDVYACNVSRDNSDVVRRLYAELEKVLLRPTKVAVKIVQR